MSSTQIVPYIGSGPYCYANALALQIGAEMPSVGTLETLTGSPFGFQLIAGQVPLFDPYGWDPDVGLDQALQLLGWTSERMTFDSPGAALEGLRETCEDGPVFIGPLEMGLLLHQPRASGPVGADHFVTVVGIDAENVTFHDPEGYPWSQLPHQVFLDAWKGDSVAYAHGDWPLRTNFRRHHVVDEADALRALLPEAATWARGRAIPMPPGSLAGAEGLRYLADLAEAGLPENMRQMLISFSIRLGSRRRSDAAVALNSIGEHDIANILQEQAKAIGAAQFLLIADQRAKLAQAFRESADLHEQLVAKLSQ